MSDRMTDPANAASRGARARDAIERLRHQVGDSMGPGGIGFSRSDGKVLLALADEAASQPREAIARALYEHRGHASDGAWHSDWATHRENGPSVSEIFLREADRLLALHDTAPTDQAQATVTKTVKVAADQAQGGGEALRWLAAEQTLAELSHGKDDDEWSRASAERRIKMMRERRVARDAAILAARATLAQSNPTDGGMA